MRMISEMWFQQWWALLEGGRTLVSLWGCVQVTLTLSWLTTPTLAVTAWEKLSHCGWDRATMYVSHLYTYTTPSPNTTPCSFVLWVSQRSGQDELSQRFVLEFVGCLPSHNCTLSIPEYHLLLLGKTSLDWQNVIVSQAGIVCKNKC